MQLLLKPLDYAQLKTEFRQIFSIGNKQGYSVLHLAILLNMEELVEAMFKFCVEQNFEEVYSIGTFDCGDTLLQLAIRKNLFNMTKLILKYDKKAFIHQNRSGCSAYDLIKPSIEENMHQEEAAIVDEELLRMADEFNALQI